jgi:transcriptional regulator with XRE-family HTH domain
VRVAATELARKRLERGLKQGELAALVRVSQSSMSLVENGHVPPWPRLRRECARILGLPEEELFPRGEIKRVATPAVCPPDDLIGTMDARPMSRAPLAWRRRQKLICFVAGCRAYSLGMCGC